MYSNAVSVVGLPSFASFAGQLTCVHVPARKHGQSLLKLYVTAVFLQFCKQLLNKLIDRPIDGLIIIIIISNRATTIHDSHRARYTTLR